MWRRSAVLAVLLDAGGREALTGNWQNATNAAYDPGAQVLAVTGSTTTSLTDHEPPVWGDQP